MKMNNDTYNNTIACVTGASGIIGSKIVGQLLRRGYRVRILTRKCELKSDELEIVYGELENEKILKEFLNNADLLFHCAGELYDEQKMWEVNVRGTERLMRLIPGSGIKYFCHISSVGVIGKTSIEYVDEETECNPVNLYEKSKWAAEQIVKNVIDGCHIVILRPANVIDEKKPGALGAVIRGSWLDCVKIFLKGGEYTHIVHAEDVAAAALYLINKKTAMPQSFIVSYDHDPLNTYAGIKSLYEAFKRDCSFDNIRSPLFLPVGIPYILRSLLKGKSNIGSIRYSPQKLFSTGFSFPLGLKEAIRRISTETKMI